MRDVHDLVNEVATEAADAQAEYDLPLLERIADLEAQLAAKDQRIEELESRLPQTVLWPDELVVRRIGPCNTPVCDPEQATAVIRRLRRERDEARREVCALVADRNNDLASRAWLGPIVGGERVAAQARGWDPEKLWPKEKP